MANNVFQVKRTSTSGRTPNTTASYATNSQYIAAGEFALNMADGILYTSNGSAVIEVGANNTNVHVTGGITLDNDKALYFKTVNSAASVGFKQQSDDNFVFYTTNTSYQPRAVFAIFANSVTSNLSFLVPLVFNTTAYVGPISANGSLGTSSQILTSNGSSTYWSSPGAASVNTAAQYTWSNLHTFQANVTFSGNGFTLTTDTGAVYFNGISDVNWKMGRNAGGLTKQFYTGNTINIIAYSTAATLEGIALGNGPNTFLETGYNGTYTAKPIYVGNSTVNVSINSTSFTGTANNATNLGGTAASGYQTTAGLSSNVATLTANNTSYVGTVTAANVVSNAQLSANLANYQTTAGLSSNVATLTANNASYLGGVAAASYVNTSGAYTISGVHTYTANLVVNSAIIAGGNSGTAGQVLTSNGSGNVYWSDVSGGSSNAVYMKGGSATIGTLAAGGSNIFRVNANTLNYNTTIAAGENAQATGPISVASGITLTVESGARVSII